VASRRFEDPDRPEHVHVGVDLGMLDRKSHVRLGGEVKDRLGTHGVEDGVWVTDVPHVELCPRRDPLPLALREVVEDVGPRRRAPAAPRRRAIR